MARIVINDLDVSYELGDKDLEAVVAGTSDTKVPTVRVDKLLPGKVFPAIGSSPLGL